MTEARGKHFDTILLSDCCASRAQDGGKAQSVVVRNCQQFGGLVLTGDELVDATRKTLRRTCGCHTHDHEHKA
jgi:nicotinamidase-related amidase